MPKEIKEPLEPSLKTPPTLELKPLPEHLKYAFLGEHDTLPVIIASDLTAAQQGKLLDLLKVYKAAIGWTIADLRGISPSLCMHAYTRNHRLNPQGEAQ